MIILPNGDGEGEFLTLREAICVLLALAIFIALALAIFIAIICYLR